MYNFLMRQGVVRFQHKVVKGDTVLKIANNYCSSIDAIILANNLVVLIYEGQLLSVGHFKPPHKVVKGDTVFDIANKNGIPMEAIILVNNLVVPIYEGQTLLIP